MQASQIHPDTLNHYEGLVRTTASLYVTIMAAGAMDFEDICQVLRVRVWKALEAFDERRLVGKAKACREGDHSCRCPRCRFVFMCVRNQGKDLVKRGRDSRTINDLHIEDVAPTINGNGADRDAFELRYLSTDDEQVFMSVLEEPPIVPSTLSLDERRVLKMLFNDYRQAEIAPILRLSQSQVKTAVKGIRAKMADWCPSATETPVPLAA